MVAANFDICKIVGRDKKHLVQLCLPYEKLKEPLHFPVCASEKLDGVFAFALCTHSDCTIFSRTGEEYVSLDHLKEPLIELSKELQYGVIIFEAYTRGVSQPTISGWCRDTKKQHPEVEAYVHDAIALNDFMGISSAEPYYMRATYLQRHAIQHPKVHIIKQRHIYTEGELFAMAESIWAKGGEGVVARPDFASYYPGKRNAQMVKLKKGVSFDLKVIDVEEGTGKYKGCIGKLICQDKNNKIIKVGSGLNDEQRKAWWANPEEIIGKVVQIDAMAVSTKGVLREPRFKGIRTDKAEVDVIE
jgi:DNA ligase-1